ncbi:MAG: nickel pincer cofactor biosynthesis protein LarC [Dehalococcoidales bacterium]|nr:nickel pincer cofactor biosynthesis protein LarC [Dehalococcoidales bacterium]
MIAYLDCYSGISGDMAVGAVVDAGVPLGKLEAELSKLPVGGYSLSAETVNRKGFRGVQISVTLSEDAQPRRHLSDILQIIEQSQLSKRVKDSSSAIFRHLAEAEASVHGTSVEEVHFHEVGAVDAIVDIVGFVVGLDALGVEKVYASAVPTGYGMVQSQHGQIPIPGPAVLELLAGVGAPVYPGRVEAELTTPTGAAILATLAAFEPPQMKISKVGYGFGRKDLPWPNALRLWLGEPVLNLEGDFVSVIETNVDDMAPELLGALMDDLLAAGALDVYFTPIQMKKNRPATKVSAIAPQSLRTQLAEMILEHTSSLGVRIYETSRLKCQRWQETVETSWGPVRVKVKALGGRHSAAPEYEDCLKIAREQGMPLKDVYEAVRLALTSFSPSHKI